MATIELHRTTSLTVSLQNDLGALTLQPGINEISDDEWALAKVHPVVKLHMDDGLLIELDDELSEVALELEPLDPEEIELAEVLEDLEDEEEDEEE